MWAIPIQKASFKGVEFDVIAVEEAFERAVIEHTYPFVNGADLEDMGLNPQQVQLQAVFFGLSYATRYNQLLSVIQQKGGGCFSASCAWAVAEYDVVLCPFTPRC